MFKKALRVLPVLLLSFQVFVLMDAAFAPSPPIVDAGPDQVVRVGTEVTLSGTIDLAAIPFTPFTYEWQLGDGSPPEAGAVTGPVTETTHYYATVGAYVATFTVYGADQINDVLQDTVQITALNPTIETYDADGNRKDVFNYGEGIYYKGTGYLPSFSHYWVYVVDDTDWVDGMPIPTTRRQGTPSTPAGNLDSVFYLWYFPPGGYDLIVDVDDDGVYDEGLDAIDDLDYVSAGFFIIPEFWLGTLMGLAGYFAAFGTLFLSKHRHIHL